MSGGQVNLLESEIESGFYDYCKAKHVLCIKLNLTGRRGWPDRLIIYRGNVWFVELKRPNEEPRLLQWFIHGILAQHYIRVYVADNLRDAKKIVDDILAAPPKL